MVHRLTAGVAALILFAAGCGGEPLPEFGQVTGALKARGKPLGGIVVTFLPEPTSDKELPINSSATTDDQGKYELTYSFKGTTGQGAAVGFHRVILLDTRFNSIPQGARMPKRFFSLDYSAPATTPLKVEVKPGENSIDLDVK